jgi:hypothetical protein
MDGSSTCGLGGRGGWHYSGSQQQEEQKKLHRYFVDK